MPVERHWYFRTYPSPIMPSRYVALEYNVIVQTYYNGNNVSVENCKFLYPFQLQLTTGILLKHYHRYP
jgi:hypothetical protein